MEYPKWVQRAPDIGAVLCQNAAEEQTLLSDWAEEGQSSAQMIADQAAATAAAIALANATAKLAADKAKRR